MQETPLPAKHLYGLKIKACKVIFQENTIWKQAGITILVSKKIEFKPKPIRRVKEDHYISIKRTKYQEDTTIVNIYAQNIRGTRHFSETNAIEHESKHIPQYDNSEWLQNPTLTN
jgi:hypothetical protein